MLVTLADLPNLPERVTLVDGCFDPLHHGHIAYFKYARQYGFKVLCHLAPDDYLRSKHRPLLPRSDRLAVLDALRDLDYVHGDSATSAEVIRALKPCVYVKGDEWQDKLPLEVVQTCGETGTPVILYKGGQQSSTRLLQQYLQEDVQQFEQRVLAQQTVAAETYDESYFQDQWRSDGNAYTLDARRTIEGEHPRLIKETFRPERVLDVGCGPGALMTLLVEQGIKEVYGIDTSLYARQLAPKHIAPHIWIADVAQYNSPLDDRPCDLVICREALEHLTVTQINQAVHNLCRWSSRYVYITTRFKLNPLGLLDFATSDDLDPSHITLLSKDFLRVLLVLNNMRCRPDLEQAMDWQRKNRCLVYEKHDD